MSLSTRQEKILDQLYRADGVLLSTDITDSFGVTVQTIRKDLNELSELGLVRRVHGGIKAPGSDVNVSFNNRTIMNLEAKQNIARKVVSLLPENTSIFLGHWHNTTTSCRGAPRSPRTHCCHEQHQCSTYLVQEPQGPRHILLAVKFAPTMRI